MLAEETLELHMLLLDLVQESLLPARVVSLIGPIDLGRRRFL